MIDKVITEMKSKPFTMVMILGLYGVVALLWVGKTDYASAGEMKDVKQQLSQLGSDFKRGNLEAQLRAINAELFALQQKVADIRAAGKRPEQIYNDRLAALQSDKERLTRELAGVK